MPPLTLGLDSVRLSQAGGWTQGSLSVFGNCAPQTSPPPRPRAESAAWLSAGGQGQGGTHRDLFPLWSPGPHADRALDWRDPHCSRGLFSPPRPVAPSPGSGVPRRGHQRALPWGEEGSVRGGGGGGNTDSGSRPRGSSPHVFAPDPEAAASDSGSGEQTARPGGRGLAPRRSASTAVWPGERHPLSGLGVCIHGGAHPPSDPNPLVPGFRVGP